MNQIYNIQKQPSLTFSVDHPVHNDFISAIKLKKPSKIKKWKHGQMACLLISLLFAIMIFIVTIVSCGIIFGTSNGKIISLY